MRDTRHAFNRDRDRKAATAAQCVAERDRRQAEVRAQHRREINLTRFGTPEDIAGLVAFMVSPRGRWLHGATIDMDGGEVRAL